MLMALCLYTFIKYVCVFGCDFFFGGEGMSTSPSVSGKFPRTIIMNVFHSVTLP